MSEQTITFVLLKPNNRRRGNRETGTIAAQVSPETPEHLRPYRNKLSDEQFTSILKAYRRAYTGQVGKGNHGGRPVMATLDTSPGPTSPSLSSSRSLAQPRHRNKPTYVQRFKVLRDRNKNLPKLDFSDKASGIPKKLQGVGSFSRSYTYDSMKLPSISTSSVVTGVSGKSVHSDGYRRKDPREKRSSLHDGQSEPYNSDFATQRELIDLSTLMSKTLENKEPGQKQNAPKPPEEKIVNDKGHRYESITYKKHLLKRHKVSDKVRSNREKSIIAQAEKHLKQTVEKELMQPKEVKDDKRDLNETQDSGFTGSGEKRKGKTPDILSKPCSPTDDVTTHQELGTPDTDIPLSPVTTATKSSIPHNDNNKT